MIIESVIFLGGFCPLRRRAVLWDHLPPSIHPLYAMTTSHRTIMMIMIIMCRLGGSKHQFGGHTHTTEQLHNRLNYQFGGHQCCNGLHLLLFRLFTLQRMLHHRRLTSGFRLPGAKMERNSWASIRTLWIGTS